MARKTINLKGILFVLLTSIVAVGLTRLFSGPLQVVEESLESFKYTLRGEQQADTNIAIVYVDDEAIRTLGWPVRRNFHALMISTLRQLNVRAIGIEVLFEEPRGEYPEYDHLLASVTSVAGNVVLPGYFGSIREEDGVWRGEDLALPMEQLREASAGTGHLNLVGNDSIPLRVRSGDEEIHAFGLEVVNVALSQTHGGDLPDKLFHPPGRTAALNYPGRISAFRMYPFLEVLRSFDAISAGGIPSLPVQSLENKIVLVGVVAAGRSAFVTTPVDPRYPSIGIQAVLVENLLNDRLLSRAGAFVTGLLGLLLAITCGLVVLLASGVGAGAVVGLLSIGVCLISYLFFAESAFQLPVLPLLLTSLTSSIAAVWYRQRGVQARLKGLESEKEGVIKQLHDREERVQALEQELLRESSSAKRGRVEELQSEIQRYKDEIRALAAKADDMVPSSDPPASRISDDGIIGTAEGQMAAVLAMIKKLAPSDSPVLILGQSGTGKELVARALHRRSERSTGPFVAVNCGALSETLLESELFGHEKGAFTGAVAEKAGRFERADGGTIFLDEIGEVSESFQVKLLRILQEGEFERVGGTKTNRVNVRVLAATNRDLKDRMLAHKFREDLYYRLNVLSIKLPPLKERKEDIPVLVHHFLSREDPHLRVSRTVLDVLQNYSWPGNVRELESTVKRGALLARADSRSMITIKDLTEEQRAVAQSSMRLDEQILQSLREKGFSRSSISETADELGGLNRGTVAEYLRGQCLEQFVKNRFDINNTVRSIARSKDPSVDLRVRKKLGDYLTNISEVVETSKPWEDSLALLRPKTKNLPQKYHPFVEQVAEAFYRGLWKMET